MSRKPLGDCQAPLSDSRRITRSRRIKSVPVVQASNSSPEEMDISGDSDVIEVSDLDTSIESGEHDKSESKRMIYESLLTLDVPKGMEEFVTGFKPKGTMKRLQEVIEMIYLNQDGADDCEISLDDLEDYDYKSYSASVRAKAIIIAESKPATETFRLEENIFNFRPAKIHEHLEKDAGNANDITLEIPCIDLELLENVVVKQEKVTNENQSLEYSDTVLKENKDVSTGGSFRIHTECKWMHEGSLLQDIDVGHKHRPELHCRRKFMRKRIKVSQFKIGDTLDKILKKEERNCFISIKPEV